MRPWSQSMVRPMRATVASMDFERQSPGVAALSLAGLVLAWQAASTLTADPSVLPSPAAVARIVVHLAETGELAHHISATLFRVAGAFGLAFALGALLDEATQRDLTLATIDLGPAIVSALYAIRDPERYGVVEFDENNKVASELGIRGIPALFMFKDGQVVTNKTGAAPKAALQGWIESAL